jgi:hypothetical protein
VALTFCVNYSQPADSTSENHGCEFLRQGGNLTIYVSIPSPGRRWRDKISRACNSHRDPLCLGQAELEFDWRDIAAELRSRWLRHIIRPYVRRRSLSSE